LSTASYPARTLEGVDALRAAMDRMAHFAEARLAALRREDYPNERAWKRELTRRRNAVLRARRIRRAMGA
jgi:hypothetical protein